MNSDRLIRQVELIRAITLKTLEPIEEEVIDYIPTGYSNSIRWNLGHILIVQDQLATHFAGVESQLPSNYITLFGNRTKPSDWDIEPPSLAMLAFDLERQTQRIQETLGHRLEEAAKKIFVRLGYEMTTIGELLNFSLHHEGIHVGIIQGLKRAIEIDYHQR